MLRTSKISRRSALKSLFIVSALPTVFISSCTKSITSPEVTQEGTSKLFKSHLDSEIASFENMRVKTNKDGIAKVPKKYLYTDNSGKIVDRVLTRESENDFDLIFRKVELISKKNKKKEIKIKGLSDGTVIIANPRSTIKTLSKDNFKALKRKFVASTKKKMGRK